MLGLPWWIKIILNLALKWGLPHVVKGVTPQIILLLENIVAQVAACPSEEHAIARLASVGEAIVTTGGEGTLKA